MNLNAQGKTRPSGCTVYTEVAVKQFPTAEEGLRALIRHQDNPKTAVKVFGYLEDQNMLVMERGMPYAGKRANLGEVLPELKKLWTAYPMIGQKHTTLDSYLAYVLRDPNLPREFANKVIEYSEAVKGEPNALQVHGDMTEDNIVLIQGKVRFIDFSVRPELLFLETDTAKFKFHRFRTYGEKVWFENDRERFFFFCHMCRVWTRDVEARKHLETFTSVEMGFKL